MASLLETPVVGSARGRFERLYADHRRAVYATALKLLGNPQDAEDSTQAAFLRAYRALERGAEPRQPRAWLLAILRNVCRDHWRESPPHADADPDEVASVDAGGDVGTAELVDAIRRLDGQQRSVFLLGEVRGLRPAEVAARLGLSEQSVRALIIRARTALRGDLEAGERGFSCLEAHELLEVPLRELEACDRRLLRAHLRACAACARAARRRRAARALRVLLLPIDGVRSVLRWLGVLQGGAAAKLSLLAAVGTIGTAATMAVQAPSGSAPDRASGDEGHARPAVGTSSAAATVRGPSPRTPSAAAARAARRQSRSNATLHHATVERQAAGGAHATRSRPEDAARLEPSAAASSASARQSRSSTDDRPTRAGATRPATAPAVISGPGPAIASPARSRPATPASPGGAQPQPPAPGASPPPSSPPADPLPDEVKTPELPAVGSATVPVPPVSAPPAPPLPPPPSLPGPPFPPPPVPPLPPPPSVPPVPPLPPLPPPPPPPPLPHP